MQQDLKVLRSAVEEAHGGLHRFATKTELDRAFADAHARLTSPRTTLAFASLLSETLSAIRDGHMRLEYDDTTTAALASAKLLPLRVASEEGRLFVVSNDSPGNTTIVPGMELVAINRRPIAEIVAAIARTLSPNGFVETGKAWRLARSFAQNYWLHVDQAASFEITARPPGGSTITATLDGITTAERAKVVNPVNAAITASVSKLEGSRDNITLSFPRGGDAAVLRVRAFDGATFVAAIERAFAALSDKGAKALILDLRGNGGGVDTYGAALVSQFMPGPFRYFDHIKVTTIRPSFATWNASTFDDLKAGTRPAANGGFLVQPSLHPGVGEQKPAARPFLGQLVVLIDGGTFSTAADVCAQLRTRTPASFIGEETGGAAEGNTSGLNAQIVLPNSRLKLRIQMYGYWNALGTARPPAPEPGRGVRPDVVVIRRTSDVLAGVDAGLDRAFALLKR